MNSDDERFAAFAAAVCQALVGNVIETRAALNVLVRRGLLSGPEIEESKRQVPPELVQKLQAEVQMQVMTTMKNILAGHSGIVQ
ncbi:MAG: hypothetical protein ABI824_10770 [Acidobacteriota bacterium]